MNTTDVFDIIIWTGAALSLTGMLIILWCIVQISRAKRAGLDDDALRARLRAVLPMNLGALFLSVIGLMLVAVGIMLS